jgi:hypothetical protein
MLKNLVIFLASFGLGLPALYFGVKALAWVANVAPGFITLH